MVGVRRHNRTYPTTQSKIGYAGQHERSRAETGMVGDSSRSVLPLPTFTYGRRWLTSHSSDTATTIPAVFHRQIAAPQSKENPGKVGDWGNPAGGSNANYILSIADYPSSSTIIPGRTRGVTRAVLNRDLIAML